MALLRANRRILTVQILEVLKSYFDKFEKIGTIKDEIWFEVDKAGETDEYAIVEVWTEQVWSKEERAWKHKVYRVEGLIRKAKNEEAKQTGRAAVVQDVQKAGTGTKGKGKGN